MLFVAVKPQQYSGLNEQRPRKKTEHREQRPK